MPNKKVHAFLFWALFSAPWKLLVITYSLMAFFHPFTIPEFSHLSPKTTKHICRKVWFWNSFLKSTSISLISFLVNGLELFHLHPVRHTVIFTILKFDVIKKGRPEDDNGWLSDCTYHVDGHTVRLIVNTHMWLITRGQRKNGEWL